MASQEGEGVLQDAECLGKAGHRSAAQACGEPLVFLHHMQSRRVSQRR